MLRRRETMIALRARRQAFRIARQIAHPRVEPPALPMPVVPPPSLDWPDEPARDPEAEEMRRSLAIGASLIVFTVGSFVLIWYLY